MSPAFGSWRLTRWSSATRGRCALKNGGGTLLGSEEYTLRGDMYLKSELQLMLTVAGFRAISVQGDYTDAPATADHAELVFTAMR